MSQESLYQIIPNVTRKEGFLKVRSYNLVLTSTRIIFARYTKEMRKADDKALVESLKGKGFKARLVATMSGNERLYESYENKSFDTILSETEGNFEIPITQILKVKRPIGVRYDDNHQEIPRKVIIVTNQTKHELKFYTATASDEAYKALKNLVK